MDGGSVASNCSRSDNAIVIGTPAPKFAPPVKSEQLPTGKRLTKDLVLSKSKGGSLVEIKKIVVWGQKITDCSIVTEIPELEVASMNANKISSLEHFGQCPNLRELFLRSNCIEDIHEIYYLKELPNLQILWLAGNPCTKHPKYRSSVIRNLEQLLKLDDTEIVPAERTSSESDGLLFEEPPARPAADLPLNLEERMRPAEDTGDAASAAASAASATAPAAEQPAETAPAAEPTPQVVGDAVLKSEDAAAAGGNGEKPMDATTAAEVAPATATLSTRPGTAGAPAPAAAAPLPRYALAEVRTAVLRLIRLLDQESLELVLLTVRSRLDKEAGAPAAPPALQPEQPAGPDMAASFSLDNL